MKKLIQSFVLFAFVIVSPLTLAETFWIDVRGADAYAQEHLEGAVNIPHTEITEKIATVTTDKNAEINLYCRSGRRAGMAKAALEKMGYTHVVNHGGYKDVIKP